MAPLLPSYGELTAPLQGIRIRQAGRPRPGDPTLYETHRPTWQAKAACLGFITQGKDWFFSHKGDAGGLTAKAKRICETCPVKVQCLEDAMLQGAFCVGVWGGTTADDRKNLRVRGIRPGPVPKEKHGTQYRYDRYRCRCDLCREAHARAQARYKARRKVA